MDQFEIKRLEKYAENEWYSDGEQIAHLPEGQILKEYYYCSGEVILYLFKDFAVVYYRPTGWYHKFSDKQRAFEFARSRANHVKAINILLW
jgi:hypothetical protein